MQISKNLRNRLDINNDSDNYQFYDKKDIGLRRMQARLNAFGGTDQWTRMRQDKLRGLKKALLYSYQSAIVQKYNVKQDNLINNIISIITLLQDQRLNELSDNQISILDKLQETYITLKNQTRNSLAYINSLQTIVDSLIEQQPLFRCLINHDKLKVDYEDKIISIPFFEPPVGKIDPIETDFHNGTIFKWVHGNKEEWTPDTYWIVYMQYSEETAYFRAEIRKADEEIEIIVIDDQGNESSVTYRGWMTGPNETTALWNVKKGVIWNDLNYTKLLYITKDEDTLAFFQRFDRVIINGKPWEVQAYNESYSTNKSGGQSSGIIRVALKEAYTSTDQFIQESLNEMSEQENAAAQYDTLHTQGRIDGPATAFPYDILEYEIKNVQEDLNWSLSDSSLAKIIKISQDNKKISLEIKNVSNKKLYLKCSNLIKEITIQSL